MNINSLTHSEIHQETHQITSCMHDHHIEKSGGMSFQSQMQQQSIREEPQTLEEALNELAAINRENNSPHKMFGTGNTLGNIVSDVNGEGKETVVMLMPENMAEARTNDNGQLHISPDMLNALVMPRNTNINPILDVNNTKTLAVNEMSGFDMASGGHLQKRKNRFFQTAVEGVKKRVSKWLRSLPDKILGKKEEKKTNKKELKTLNKEYILDSYDRTGQYLQIEKTGIINDNLNQKA